MTCSRNAFRMRLMMAMKKSRKPRKPRKKSRKRKSGKRPLNAFMKKKEAARKSGKKTFTYTDKKGTKNTYVRAMGGSKGQLVIYRKKSGKRKSPKKKSVKRKKKSLVRKKKSVKRKKKSRKCKYGRDPVSGKCRKKKKSRK